MHDFSVTLDSKAKVVDFDDMSNILGYKKSEVIGQNWFEVFIANEDKKKILKVFSALFDTGDIQTIDSYSNDIKTKNNKHLFIDFANEMFKDKNGELFVRSNGKEHYK